ncbi:DUF1684 domain-containing protein [Phaeocystidibacter luteus]|uniref:DUF1684 domain-containing protein n=1 Tax=Phaeocystidibacter luteus TaxID=911197 RepID=A0A6N6RIX4_9FLAO|nr:DUF1684 domain-containing protein [Phaeocystidibacter luteus]KAB2810328.1 DUF1684 domain-containing protein [Phaeocystidibacter luteus]
MIRLFLALLILSTPLLAQPDDINDRIRFALEAQAELDSSYANADESPLEKDDFEHFDGHPYFPIDTTWMVWAEVILTPDSVPFEMATTTSRKPVYRQYAILRFTHGDTTLDLAVYQSQRLMTKEGYEDYLFLPFGDMTNGFKSYGGGRYLDLRIPEGDSIYIDFNRSYNPYCAYSGRYSCPKVPLRNILPVSITAGVQAPKGH